MFTPDTPQWLRTALSITPDERDIGVEGENIRYYAWGETGGTPVVLVHGGLAHAHWWDHIAPFLSGRRVVALDLSGHGDSGSRESYNAHQWAREIIAVIRHAQLSRPIVVGHSMGGQPATACGGTFAEEIAGVITVDTRFNDAAYSRRDKPSAIFASLEEGVSEFAPIHAALGAETIPALVQHIATTSLKRVSAGWRWKRDDGYHIQHMPFRQLLSGLTVPIAIVRTEYGLVTPTLAAEMIGLTRGGGVDVEIPSAAHNPMIEQPVAFISVLRALLATWPATNSK